MHGRMRPEDMSPLSGEMHGRKKPDIKKVELLREKMNETEKNRLDIVKLLESRGGI